MTEVILITKIAVPSIIIGLLLNGERLRRKDRENSIMRMRFEQIERRLEALERQQRS